MNRSHRNLIVRNNSSCRFTLLDLMVLIAALAVGVAWNRAAMPDYALYLSPFRRCPAIVRAVNFAIWILVPHLVLWSFAVLAIAFGRQRRPILGSARQPVYAACWAAVGAASLEAFWYVPFRLGHPGGVVPGIMVIHASETASYAVIGAWTSLAIGGMWKPDRSWTDRLGLLLGITWIGVILILRFRNLLL